MYLIPKMGQRTVNNPFDKGPITNFIEAIVSTFSNSGLSKRAASLDVIRNTIDEESEEGSQAQWESVIDRRVFCTPVNWSRTFLCGVLEIDCPMRDMFIIKMEQQKAKLRARNYKDKLGGPQNHIDLNNSCSSSDDEEIGEGYSKGCECDEDTKGGYTEPMAKEDTEMDQLDVSTADLTNTERDSMV